MSKSDTYSREEIERQAKKILDEFSSELEKVEIRKKEYKNISCGFRGEGEGAEGSRDFRERMFGNAKNTEGDCIIAEVKSW